MALGGQGQSRGRGTGVEFSVLVWAGRLGRAERREEAGSLLLAEDRGLRTPLCKEKGMLIHRIASRNSGLASQTIFPSLQRLRLPQGQGRPVLLGSPLLCPRLPTSSAGTHCLPLQPFP